MTVQQYLRKAVVAVGSAGGAGQDFSAFRCVFNVRRGDFQNPNSCDLRIYNLSDDTAHSLANPNSAEFTQVAISAGYDGNFGLIFNGTIKQVRIGRENQKDTYVDITAADGDRSGPGPPACGARPSPPRRSPRTRTRRGRARRASRAGP